MCLTSSFKPIPALLRSYFGFCIFDCANTPDKSFSPATCIGNECLETVNKNNCKTCLFTQLHVCLYLNPLKIPRYLELKPVYSGLAKERGYLESLLSPTNRDFIKSACVPTKVFTKPCMVNLPRNFLKKKKARDF